MVPIAEHIAIGCRCQNTSGIKRVPTVTFSAYKSVNTFQGVSYEILTVFEPKHGVRSAESGAYFDSHSLVINERSARKCSHAGCFCVAASPSITPNRGNM